MVILNCLAVGPLTCHGWFLRVACWDKAAFHFPHLLMRITAYRGRGRSWWSRSSAAVGISERRRHLCPYLGGDAFVCEGTRHGNIAASVHKTGSRERESRLSRTTPASWPHAGGPRKQGEQ